MIEVPYVGDVDVNDAGAVSEAFAKIAPNTIGCCNWPDLYPYQPKAEFRMFHTGDNLVVRYDVDEKYTMALVDEDMGEVWTDSCVEFFFQPYGKGKYYNLEATCTGRILLTRRSGRNDPTPASPEVLKSVLRYPSLGSGTFAETCKGPWSLTLVIPASAYFEDDITSFHGFEGRANVYKCGDNLSTRSYLSFSPIKTEKPDFHRPEFFTVIKFR